MIAELGHYALVLAFGLALVQGSLPLVGAARRDAALLGTASPTALGQLLCLTLAFAVLIYAHVTSDFSLENVVANSSASKPLIYKVSGVWGNHEGSLVLWAWILALFGAAVAVFGGNLPAPFRARVLGVQGLIGSGFLAFMLLTSNPFLRLDPAPIDGNGFNPILQDPGLAIHPPMLYLGYVGLSTAYSFAVAALLEGRVDAVWARWVRPWTLIAWVALTLGIALGSYWAYYELGWGGWWFWDPVENASFMPWLAATALLHSSIVVEKRDTLKSWTILLAILAFSLSLLGTFLVRSGVLTSVHAFATDPARGVFILLLLAVAIGGSLALYAWRAPALQAGGVFAPVSREGALLLNNLLLATACATVLLGTLYPLLLDVVGGPKISVGPPYFEGTFVPLMVPLLVAIPIGSMLAWKRGDLAGVLGRLGAATAVTVAAVLLTIGLADARSALGAMGVGLGVWVIAGSLVELASRVGLARIPLRRSFARARGLPRSAYAAALAHVGVGALILGITVSGTMQAERILTMRPGDTTELAGYEIAFAEIVDAPGPNFIAQQARFAITQAGEALGEVISEKRAFPVEQQTTTEAGILTSFWRDLYVVLGDPTPDGTWTVRVYYNPLVLWIWGGPVLMALGGLLSLSDRRLRVGAPRPARLPLPAVSPTASEA